MLINRIKVCSCDQRRIEKIIISIRCWSQLRDRPVYDIKGVLNKMLREIYLQTVI